MSFANAAGPANMSTVFAESNPQTQEQITQARDSGAFAGFGSSNMFPTDSRPAPFVMPNYTYDPSGRAIQGDWSGWDSSQGGNQRLWNAYQNQATQDAMLTVYRGPDYVYGGGYQQWLKSNLAPTQADFDLQDKLDKMTPDQQYEYYRSTPEGQKFQQQLQEQNNRGPLPSAQQFPNLMQNPAFNPQAQTQPQAQTPTPPAQQLQQIAQGVPSLVNQLAPPPRTGPVPGSSITQQPPASPQAQPRFPNLQQNPAFSRPALQPQPRPQMPAPQPRFPALNQNPVFNPRAAQPIARPAPVAATGNQGGLGPMPTLQDRLLNPAYNPQAQQRNANSLAQALAIQQANPAFLPTRMMPATAPRITPTPRATFTPPRLDAGVRTPTKPAAPVRRR